MEENIANSVKTIVLVICASNYERHQHIIKSVHSELSKRGPYVLYVLTNYGIYFDSLKMDFSHGEAADYSLLDTMKIDGCILESNLASMKLVNFIMDKLKKRNIPTVTINLDLDGVPSVKLDVKRATYELMSHLTEKHGCKKINLVMNEGSGSISEIAEQTYREVIAYHNITPEDNRIMTSTVGINQGRQLYDKFDQLGVMQDCDAVICVHDVCAIGLVMELEDRGKKVPEDIKVCSLNHSNNSKAFRPDITGIDPMEPDAAAKACDVLISLMNGLPVPMETIYEGKTMYRRSCGCIYQLSYEKDTAGVYQSIIYNKIEAGSQIMNMMRFNDMLEQVETIDQFGENMEKLMTGLGISRFFCCLNESDISYIMSDKTDHKSEYDDPYDEYMKVIAVSTDKPDKIKRGLRFPKSKVIPVEPSVGDLLLVYLQDMH